MDSFLWGIIIVACVLVIIVGLYSIISYNNELESYDDTMMVVSKTIYSVSESEKEVCVLEDHNQNRFVSNADNGCKYNIGDVVKVHISKNGNSIRGLSE